ncbi:MAG: hypothetical protein HZB41_10200 [Ignavibacteriae bacterium]|nr:hypothetical protein [Ignavibacteriota bacterium]
MKLIYDTFFYFIFFSLLNSCNDISNYSDNSFRTPILKILSKEDSLAYLSYKDIDFGKVHWHRIPNLKVVFNNNSETDTVLI